MNKAKKLENKAIDKLNFLEKKYKFMAPVINKNVWNTTMYWLNDEIAIELEFDWRDLDLLVLIVALKDGKLPSEYYISEGKTCRIHLEKLLEEKLGIESNYIKDVIGAIPERSKRDENFLENLLDRYSLLIKDHISIILEQGKAAFDDLEYGR